MSRFSVPWSVLTASIVLFAWTAPVTVASASTSENVALLKSITGNSVGGVTRALNRGADPNAIDQSGISALSLAALKRENAICSLLIKHGSLVDFHGRSALFAAVASNDPKTIGIVLPHEKDINAFDTDAHATSLMIAADFGNPAIVKLLLDYGASAKMSTHGWTALQGDASHMNRKLDAQPVAVAKLLLDGGAPIDSVAEYGGTALMLAAQDGNEALVALPLDRGASVNIQDPTYGNTALINAAGAKSVGVVKLLLQHGADPSPRNLREQSALDIATADKQADIIKLLEPHN